MEILGILKRRWLISALFLALLISSTVWASGADVTITSVKKFDNSVLSSSYVKLVYGSIVNYDAVWAFSSSTFGFGPGAGDNISVKATAWDSDTPATSPDPDKHYGFLTGSTSGMGELPSTITGSITAKYRAYMPFDPIVTTVSEVKTTNLQTDAVSGNLTISGGQQLPGNGEDAQISTYHWRYRIGTGDPIDVATSGNLVLNEAVGPATYYFSLALENQWGTTSYSPEESYPFGGPGGDGVQEQVTLILSKATDGLGINSIAVPFANVYDSGGVAVTNLKELALAINAAGDGYVATIGYWQGQQEVGFTLDDTGNVLTKVNTDQNPEDIALNRTMGYQISVTADKSVTLRNY